MFEDLPGRATTPSPSLLGKVTERTTDRPSQKRINFTTLEPLRGIAALLVVVYHAGWVNPLTEIRFFDNGFLMVDLFFVLSGFVITHSYHSRISTALEFRTFLWLRFWRVYPLHFIFLCAFLSVELTQFDVKHRVELINATLAYFHSQAKPFLANIFLLHSAGITHSLSFNYPSWSISAECINYLMFAVLIRVVGNGRSFVLAAMFLITVSFALLLWIPHQPLEEFTFSWGAVRCSAGFFLGSITWFMFTHFKLKVGMGRTCAYEMLPTLAILATGAFIALVYPHSRTTFFFPVLCAGLIFCLAQSLSDWTARALSTPSLLWLGRVSYSIYMVHALVNWVISKCLLVTLHPRMVVINGESLLDTPTIVSVPLLLFYIAAVLGLSQVSFTFIEEPFRRFAKSSNNVPFKGKPGFPVKAQSLP